MLATRATADLIQQVYSDEPRLKYVRDSSECSLRSQSEECMLFRIVRSTSIRNNIQDHPGVSMAMNCGIMAAKGEILAFAADDAIAETYWLTELVKGFGVAENVACVSGLVLPLELDTPAQFLFEAFGGFTRGFTRRVFDL